MTLGDLRNGEHSAGVGYEFVDQSGLPPIAIDTHRGHNPGEVSHDYEVGTSRDETVSVAEIGVICGDLAGDASGDVEAPELADVALSHDQCSLVVGDDDAAEVEAIILADGRGGVGPGCDRPFPAVFGDSEDLRGVEFVK